MLSMLFRGQLGEWIAPRPDATNELYSFIRGGLFDKALGLFRTRGLSSISLETLEKKTGLGLIHLACASGSLELLVEFLSQGASVHIKSADGNYPLHYAAMNDRRAICEILLRSGADPSLPNDAGKLAVELTKDPELVSLLLRDRVEIVQSIFSPIGLVREDLRQYIQAVTTGINDDITAEIEDGEEYDNEYDDYDDMRSEESVSIDVPEIVVRLSIRAMKETALADYMNSEEFESVMAIFKNCQKLNAAVVRELLTAKPSLAYCRATNLGNVAPDGQTPLHCAAFFDNVPMMEILLQIPGTSCLMRDIKGRTALHIAVERNHENATVFLRDAFHKETGVYPDGENAPVDLACRTPLGRRYFVSQRPKPEIEKLMFSPGDKSILPRTPHTNRRKGNTRLFTTSHCICAFHEAQGNNKAMEDRTFLSASIPGRPDWSLVAVFDGHGGDYSSQFLADKIKEVTVHAISVVSEEISFKSIVDEREFMSDVLNAVCESLERMLSADPLMIVIPKGSKLKCVNSSGSTAIIALISPTSISIANVGDSRAVVSKVELQGDIEIQSVEFATTDHKLCIPEEYKRAIDSGAIVTLSEKSKQSIEASGGDEDQIVHPLPDHCYYVSVPSFPSKLSMSRSFGDFFLKRNSTLSMGQQAVVAIPDIYFWPRLPSNQFLVLACDGVWDVMTNDEVVDFVHKCLTTDVDGNPLDIYSNTEEDLIQVCEALIDECFLNRKAHDNLSAAIVLLRPTTPLLATAHLERSSLPPQSATISGNIEEASTITVKLGTPPRSQSAATASLSAAPLTNDSPPETSPSTISSTMRDVSSSPRVIEGNMEVKRQLLFIDGEN